MPLGQKYARVGVGNRKQRVAVITWSRCRGEGGGTSQQKTK